MAVTSTPNPGAPRIGPLDLRGVYCRVIERKHPTKRDVLTIIVVLIAVAAVVLAIMAWASTMIVDST